MKFTRYLLLAGVILMSGNFAWALSDENRPAYQQEYDAYLQDLEVIAETGKAPENHILKADLAKMNSNQKILLTASKKDETLKVAQNDGARIVDSVEIIRVPEEFQKDYVDVYQEEKTISAQSLVETQRAEQKAIISRESDKITNHLNPFRFLKEVKLSSEPTKIKKVDKKEEINDPMAKAYFGGF